MKQKNFISAQELQDKELPPIEWLVEGLLPIGVNFLCAPSKMGKSWMVLQLAITIAEGKPFLDFPSHKHKVIYYALEDNLVRLQSRLNILLKDEDAPDGIYFQTEANNLDNGLIEDMTEKVIADPAIGLIIIDTFQKIRGKTQFGETAYAYDYREVNAFKKFSDEHNVGVLLVHHTRKQKDEDSFNQVSGTVGLMGSADNTFVLSKNSRQDATAILHSTGRDVQQNDFTISFDKNSCRWRMEGNEVELQQQSLKREYENSILVMTIRGLVEFSPNEWTGTATQLIAEIEKIFGKQPYLNERKVGRMIDYFVHALEANHGIKHDYHRTSNGRFHRFYKIPAQLILQPFTGEETETNPFDENGNI